MEYDKKTLFKRCLQAADEHVAPTIFFGVMFLALSTIGGITLVSVWKSAAQTVCFAHHSPVECDPSLRPQTREEKEEKTRQYLNCLGQHGVEVCTAILR